MPIFILHGFVIRLLSAHNVAADIPDGPVMALFLIGISIAIVVVFSISIPKRKTHSAAEGLSVPDEQGNG